MWLVCKNCISISVSPPLLILMTKIWWSLIWCWVWLSFYIFFSSSSFINAFVNTARKNGIILHIIAMHQSESYSPTVFDLPGKDRWKNSIPPTRSYLIILIRWIAISHHTTHHHHRQWHINDVHPITDIRKVAGESSFYCIPDSNIDARALQATLLHSANIVARPSPSRSFHPFYSPRFGWPAWATTAPVHPSSIMYCISIQRVTIWVMQYTWRPMEHWDIVATGRNRAGEAGSSTTTPF